MVTLRSLQQDFDFKLSGALPRHAADTLEVDFWNLGPTTKAFIKSGNRINVRIGYVGGQLYGVFVGIIYNVVTDRPQDGADIKTTAYLRDATSAFRVMPIVATYKDAFIEDIVADLAAKARIPIGRLDLTGFKVSAFTAGTVSLEDDLRSLARHAAKATGEDWFYHMRPGSFAFVKATSGVATATVLSARTGLLHLDYVSQGIQDPDSQEQLRLKAMDSYFKGTPPGEVLEKPKLDISFEATLKGSIYADALIYVSHPLAEGFYRVKEFTHQYKCDGASKTSGVASADFIADADLIKPTVP